MKKAEPAIDDPCKPRHFRPAAAPAPSEGPAKAALEVSHTRLLITGALFLLAFLVIAARLIDVAGFKSGDVRIARHTAPRTVAARADIVDRNGTLLATTLDAPSLFANPKLISEKRETAHALAGILSAPESEIYAKLSSDRSFIWLARQLTPRQKEAINQLGTPGLQFENEGKRVYPQSNLTSHIVGFAGVDNEGLAGIERGFDDTLRHGDPVQLAVDLRLQYILKAETAKQMTDFNAVGAAGLIMDVRTGEILALTSLPDFDPASPGTAKPDQLFDRATLGVYELGSVFKIFNTAMVLDSGIANIATQFDATKPIQIANFTIHDDEPKKRWLSVAEVFEYSSNIGSAKMAEQAGTDRQREFLGRVGLLKTPTFEIPELGSPQYPRPWRPINTLTIAFGHGISVSPLQLASAAAAVVNGGVLNPATIVKRPDGMPSRGQQVLSPQVSATMRKLLRLVVDSGTGRLAKGSGYLIGGKTGTAEKIQHGHYAKHALISSFVGVFPMNDPRYLVFMLLDEPHGNAKSGGWATAGMVVAPGVRRVVERIAPVLGIQPVDENSPEILRSLMVGSPNPQGRTLAAN